MPQSPFLTAQEAATELGVKLPTLYSYVSRGLIRSEASGNIATRTSLLCRRCATPQGTPGAASRSNECSQRSSALGRSAIRSRR